MISYLKGKVIAQGPEYIITETGGVGYKVQMAEKYLSQFSTGKEVELFCYLHLKREETMELYGFLSPDQLRLFEVINGISGIGPKVALTISSLGTTQELKKAIDQRDERFFAGVKGLGKKRLQKVILELTGRLEDGTNVSRTKIDRKDETLQALIGLGFSVKDAKDAISQINSQITDTEARIKQALKLLKR